MKNLPESAFPQPEPEPLDAATLAAINEAEASYERGEGVTLEQSTINMRKRIESWRNSQRENLHRE